MSTHADPGFGSYGTPPVCHEHILAQEGMCRISHTHFFSP
jgi:hypothetical protein